MNLNSAFLSINTDKCEIETNNNKLNSNKIIITVPINSLNNINIIPNIKWSKNEQPIPYNLFRIYAKYSTPWFKNMSKIITDKNLSMIIPINYKMGLIMISYTDNIKATYWNNIETIDKLKKEIKKELKLLFPNINIPDPEWLSLEYWNEGCHAWGTNMDNNKIMDNITKQLGNNIYLINESYSFLQGWIEGSLEMTHNILNKINGGSIKYTINDVKKHNTLNKGVWTIINNKVYDITKWVPNHPGGIAKIMQIAGKDGTELFMNNPFHKGTDANKILEKYYIGELD
jgi:cytochrome b involved in lipid metabolism